ncbi:MAG: protein kinase [Legionellales bacterium]|jgi:serine/threonine protein kinase
MFKNQAALQLQQDNRQLRRKIEFTKFLQDIARFLPGVKKPKCFISYAWEDNTTDAGKALNAIWQERLSRLKSDLEKIGAEVFLDIYNMHGDMPARMKENIDKSDIIFLIGTPRLKFRLQQIPQTNAAFEWAHIKNKVAQDKDCLLPLWFEGDFGAAFPAEVQKDLVRDMREVDAHEIILAALANPMGIIPNIFQLHQRDADDAILQQYRICWEKLEASLRLIDAIDAQAKPGIDPQLLINFFDIKLEKKLTQKAHEELYLGSWKGNNVSVKRVNIINAETKKEFIREAQIMARLRHPNVLTLYGVSLDIGNESLVLEHLPKTLALRLSGPALPPQLQQKVALDIAKGLLYLHEHQNHILHQDLSSENIVLDDQYQAKLTGFGFAQAHTKSIAKGAKASSSIAWMAPEVIRNEPYTAKADVYSYGVILWEIITGKVPTATLSFDNIPSGYLELIQACLAEQPQRRPNVQDIITKLETLSSPNQNNFTSAALLTSLPLHNDQAKKAELLFLQAKILEKSNDHQAAFKLYMEAAKLGDAKSEANVGAYLLQGIGGVGMDKISAYHYLLSAANKGEPKAQYNLARMLEKGDGVSQDLTQAKYRYTQAAQQTVDTKTAEQARAKIQTLTNNLALSI